MQIVSRPPHHVSLRSWILLLEWHHRQTVHQQNLQNIIIIFPIRSRCLKWLLSPHWGRPVVIQHGAMYNSLVLSCLLGGSSQINLYSLLWNCVLFLFPPSMYIKYHSRREKMAWCASRRHPPSISCTMPVSNNIVWICLCASRRESQAGRHPPGINSSSHAFIHAPSSSATTSKPSFSATPTNHPPACTLIRSDHCCGFVNTSSSAASQSSQYSGIFLLLLPRDCLGMSRGGWVIFMKEDNTYY